MSPPGRPPTPADPLTGPADTVWADRLVAALTPFLSAGTGAAGHPAFPGFVAGVVRPGRAPVTVAAGDAVRYADAGGTPLPPARRRPMRPDTLFDLASLTKVFTAIVALQLAREGRLGLDEPVARRLPAFGGAGRDAVTLRMLLTHTAGLPATRALWPLGTDPASRRAAALATVLEARPGTTYAYSDIGLIVAGVLVETVTGQRLDAVVTERICEPLGLVDTGYRPAASRAGRAAATEVDTVLARGLVCGVVHDENAASLGGVAGHAGLFSTAADLATLAADLLAARHGRSRLLGGADAAGLVFADAAAGFPGHGHSLALELDQPWYMGALAGPATAGHTGFTGTSLVLDPRQEVAVVLLTNRVHPRREWGETNAARRSAATAVARLLGVGGPGWLAAPPRRPPATLVVPAGAVRRVGWHAVGAAAAVAAVRVTVSADAGRTWSAVPAVRRDLGRADDVAPDEPAATWSQWTATLPPGPVLSCRVEVPDEAGRTSPGLRLSPPRVVVDGRPVAAPAAPPAAGPGT